MENPASIILGTNYLYKYIKNEFYNSKIVFKINLVILLIIHLFMMYQLFYKNAIINFFDYKFGYALFIFYLLYTYLPLDMVLVEFGIWKKSTLNTKLLNYSKQLLELGEKRHSKPNKITKLQDEVIILNKKSLSNNETIRSVKDALIKGNKNHIDFVKKEFEPTKNLLNKTTKRTTIIEDQIFIKEKIKVYCSLKDIKSLFLEYRKDLFENLDVHNFIKYMFEGESKISENVLYSDEINNILAILTLLIQEEKIDDTNTVLYRLAKPYLKFDIKLKMFGIKIKNKKYSLTNDKVESHILDRITNF